MVVNKIFKSLIVVLAILLGCFSFADDMQWERYEKSLKALQAQFSSAKLSEAEKVKLLPRTNSLLSTLQDVDLDPAQNKIKIRRVVALLAAAIDADFANSLTSTIYYDYKSNKAEYVAVIKSIKSKETRERITESFKMWEEFDKKKDDPAITGRPRSN